MQFFLTLFIASPQGAVTTLSPSSQETYLLGTYFLFLPLKELLIFPKNSVSVLKTKFYKPQDPLSPTDNPALIKSL